MTSPKLISLLLCSLLACSVNAHAQPDSSSTEAQLVKSLQAINDNHLDIALNEVDNLLRANPNFKLAQLVKGDLLMARAGAIDNIGSAANAPRDKIEDSARRSASASATGTFAIRHQARAAFFVANGRATENSPWWWIPVAPHYSFMKT